MSAHTEPHFASPAAFAAWLREVGLEAGLALALDQATELVGSAPGAARRCAELAAGVAVAQGLHEFAARADYLCAQTHAIDADFARALELIASAREQYLAAGLSFDALRTSAGRIGVLEQVGRYDEAIGLARDTLHALDDQAGDAADLLRARVELNLGVCYLAVGRPDDALAAYDRAEAHYHRLDDPEGAAQVLNNHGVVLLELGRAAEAADLFARAQAGFDALSLVLESAHAHQNAGYAHVLVGDYGAGFAAFERARRILEPLEASADKHALLLDLADAYRSLNLLAEAEITYREARASLAASGAAHERARAEWGLGEVLAARGQLDEASAALDASAVHLRAVGNDLALSSVLLQQSAVAARVGRTDAALALAASALAAGGRWPLQRAQAHLHTADLLMANPSRAREHLTEAEPLVASLALPRLRQMLLARLGRVEAALGHAAAAERALTEAVALVESQRAMVGGERMRAAFLTDKVGAFDDLIGLHLAAAAREPDRVRAAFDVSERARARSLVDQMASALGVAGEPGPDAALLQRRRALRVQLDAMYSALLAGSADDDASQRAVALEQDLARLDAQAQAQSAGGHAATLPLDEICAALPGDLAVVCYYTLGDRIVAFVLPPGKAGEVAVVEAGSVAAVRELQARLEAHWDRVSADPELAQRHATQLERSVRAVLAALYDQVFRSIEARLPAARWVIVPHGPLHQLPFHALHDGHGYVIERCEVSYAPSATALALASPPRPSRRARACVFGASDPLIPHAAREAAMVAGLLSQRDVALRVDAEATREAFMREAPGCDLVHVACHGLFRAGNPMFSSIKLHDGWLLGLDLARIDLRGAAVTLSACESGRSEASAGDEILGLTRSFLGAGAATLVVSLWLAHDQAAAELMVDWYSRQAAGMSAAAALRAAQLAALQRWGHPYFWAPFVLVGRR